MSVNHVRVLLSGGIDSTAVVQFYKNQQKNIDAIFIDYGQLSKNQEIVAASQVCTFYNIDLNIIKISGLGGWKNSFIPGRNGLLLQTALMSFPYSFGIIALGVHAGTQYPDCSAIFIKQMQSIFDIYSHGQIMVGAPFIEWYKQDIWEFCKLNNVPTSITYSCEKGLKQPCGGCISCKDLEVLYAL
jgi:7-cyano-7-deazaguanine synthase